MWNTPTLPAGGARFTIEDINGDSYENFLNSKNIMVLGSYDNRNIADLQFGEKVTFGFYSGTQYKTISLFADCHYYVVDYDDGIKRSPIELPVEMTKEGYAIIDCSAIPVGKSVLQVSNIYGAYRAVIEKIE